MTGARVGAATVGTLLGIAIVAAGVYAFRAEIAAAVRAQVIEALPASVRGLVS